MRRSIIVLASLALGIPAMTAVAQTTGAVDAYRGARGDARLTGGADGIIIGHPQAERNAVIARLNERQFANSNGTIAGESAGGSGMGGSAGGVGAR